MSEPIRDLTLSPEEREYEERQVRFIERLGRAGYEVAALGYYHTHPEPSEAETAETAAAWGIYMDLRMQPGVTEIVPVEASRALAHEKGKEFRPGLVAFMVRRVKSPDTPAGLFEDDA